MKLFIILLGVAVVVCGVVIYNQNKSLKNADSYAGKTLDADFRKKPLAA